MGDVRKQKLVAQARAASRTRVPARYGVAARLSRRQSGAKTSRPRSAPPCALEAVRVVRKNKGAHDRRRSGREQVLRDWNMR